MRVCDGRGSMRECGPYEVEPLDPHIYSVSTCARHERRAGTERTWEARAVEFIGGVQYCFHFDRSSHDAFLKRISRGTRALRESTTASVAHMNRKTRHPKTWRRTLLHPAPRRPVKVCRPKSNADAPFGQCTSGRWSSLARPHCFEG